MSAIFDRVLKASIIAHELRHSMKRKFATGMASLVALTPLSALADGSLTDMVDEGATGMSDVEKDALVFAEGLGVLIVIGSIIAMKNKSKNPHITTGGIITGWVVGIFLIGLGEIVRRSQSQVGMTEVTVGSGS
ncbi:DUF6750 family protein [Klebsiella pneumoniae]|uniref:DUF6750 family protein n=1 Tax=Klebsiella pneumoniae TaxID=573 RepID=UPI0003BE8432|nr:DUF6750 family protein [Klebsiella pneumoniae]EJD6546520.1 conjugal transfer protein TraR [Klebsiella pneumoniae]ESL46705.1 hypothetical protein L460_04926 [Klebsiella pneumoniae BIDMC 24]KMB34789.1 hypothetical protein SL56_04952 [Klebsiella pneumoniae]MBD7493111.1 conjugal transfer protein TraR [Klebsiella pneumoniae]MBG1738885.1 conjugal transfer protein TraR [Klebsiella pneumoniae]